MTQEKGHHLCFDCRGPCRHRRCATRRFHAVAPSDVFSSSLTLFSVMASKWLQKTRHLRQTRACDVEMEGGGGALYREGRVEVQVDRDLMVRRYCRNKQPADSNSWKEVVTLVPPSLFSVELTHCEASFHHHCLHQSWPCILVQHGNVLRGTPPMIKNSLLSPRAERKVARVCPSLSTILRTYIE